MKRFLSIIIMMVIILSLAACSSVSDVTTTGTVIGSQQPTTTASNQIKVPSYLNMDSTMPIVKEGQNLTLKIVAVQGSGFSAKPEDHWTWKYFEKYCNLKTELTYYPGESWGEQRNLLFSSGDLPDIFYRCGFSTSDMIKYGQEEKLFYPMEDLISNYAPLLQKAIKENPSIKLETTTPDGHMYCIPSINNSSAERPVDVPRQWINKSWLTALNMNIPKTLDDFVTVLTAFKEKDPNNNGLKDEVAWLGYNNNAQVIVLTALGMNASSSMGRYTKADGTVTMPFLENNYIHYLEFMKQALDKELLNNDYYTMKGDQFNAIVSKNVVGVSFMSAPVVYMTDPKQFEQYEAITPMTSQYNNTQVWPINSNILQGQFAIAHNTKYPEACMRMANIFFTDEAPVLFFWGPISVENGSSTGYEVSGWDPIKYVKQNNEWVQVLPKENKEAWAYLNNYVGIQNGWEIGFVWSYDLIEKQLGIKVLGSAGDFHFRDSIRKHTFPYAQLTMPTLFLESNDLERANELLVPISDYVKTNEAKFITGSQPLNNLDAFNKGLKDLKIDEYMQIYQKAYKKYLAMSGK